MHQSNSRKPFNYSPRRLPLLVEWIFDLPKKAKKRVNFIPQEMKPHSQTQYNSNQQQVIAVPSHKSYNHLQLQPENRNYHQSQLSPTSVTKFKFSPSLSSPSQEKTLLRCYLCFVCENSSFQISNQLPTWGTNPLTPTSEN